jgi:hypothetical protein
MENVYTFGDPACDLTRAVAVMTTIVPWFPFEMPRFVRRSRLDGSGNDDDFD